MVQGAQPQWLTKVGVILLVASEKLDSGVSPSIGGTGAFRDEVAIAQTLVAKDPSNLGAQTRLWPGHHIGGILSIVNRERTVEANSRSCRLPGTVAFSLASSLCGS